MKWNPNTYDEKHPFISEYGKDLLSFLPTKSEQKILDIGCGTGTLTSQLASFGEVLGIDGSEEMIRQAQENFPTINFQVQDALTMTYKNQWDIVFSNAAFHWISNHEKLIYNIEQALTSQGKLICEFGAKGNIQIVEESFQEALLPFNVEYHSKFTFPTVDSFQHLLNKNGFTVDQIYDFPRPTVLSGGQIGLINFAKQFFETELSSFNSEEQLEILTRFEENARGKLWQKTQWVTDYRRLRVISSKP